MQTKAWFVFTQVVLINDICRSPPRGIVLFYFFTFLQQSGDKPADALITIYFQFSEFGVFGLLLAEISSV